jgi:hypothetical protein
VAGALAVEAINPLPMGQTRVARGLALDLWDGEETVGRELNLGQSDLAAQQHKPTCRTILSLLYLSRLLSVFTGEPPSVDFFKPLALREGTIPFAQWITTNATDGIGGLRSMS